MQTAPANAQTPSSPRRLFIVGLGGSTRPGSSTERAVQIVLDGVAADGAQTAMFAGADLLKLPIYAPENTERSSEQRAFVDAVRRCDGLVIGSPGYHGSVSGLVKNALDHLEDLSGDVRPYLDGRPVGCVVTSYGWQAAVSTLWALRAVVHALRGWPTPYGATLNMAATPFGSAGQPCPPSIGEPLAIVAGQIKAFNTRGS